MGKRFVIGCVGALCVILAVVLANPPNVAAHGEAADEPFLKNMTTAFFNVSVSPTEIEVGEPVRVTGSVKNPGDVAAYARDARNCLHYAGRSRTGLCA